MPPARFFPLILAAVGGLAAGYLALLPKSSSPSLEKSGPAAGDETPVDALTLANVPDGPMRPVWQYFAVHDGPSTPKPTRNYLIRPDLRPVGIAVEEHPRASEQPDYRWPPIQSHCDIRFLIATVPDPIDTPFGYLCDQYIEAMQRAAERARYIFDRKWLP
jgi:hypothetical protein